MKKFILFLAAAVMLAAAANPQDHGSDSVVFIRADDLQAGKAARSDARFVTSGQPDEAALRAIADAGFSAVVDFRSPHEDRGIDEQETVERLGMVYVTLPIDGPTEVTFNNAAALDQILADNEGRILLHCSSGNRAAAIYTLREKMLGAANDDALTTGKAAGLTRLESVVRERLAEE